MLLLKDNKTSGDKDPLLLNLFESHCSVINCFPISAHPVMFYSLCISSEINSWLHHGFRLILKIVPPQ